MKHLNLIINFMMFLSIFYTLHEILPKTELKKAKIYSYVRAIFTFFSAYPLLNILRASYSLYTVIFDSIFFIIFFVISLNYKMQTIKLKKIAKRKKIWYYVYRSNTRAKAKIKNKKWRNGKLKKIFSLNALQENTMLHI